MGQQCAAMMAQRPEPDSASRKSNVMMFYTVVSTALWF